MDKYKIRGVSSQKEDVHNAIKGNIDKGIYPDAFCKVVEDYLGNDKNYCNIMHSDGAGTKSSLAYLYYRETGDLSVFKGIVQDALIMNIDDLLCTGAIDNFLVSNTIGRNPKYISGEIVKVLINSFDEIINWLNELGLKTVFTGGETADVGDVVRTLIVDSTVITRSLKKDIITNEKIKPGLVIVGLSSSGKANYENEYNSGIGSNGLTSARHDLFNKIYRGKYPESYNPNTPSEYVYSGPYKVTDKINKLPVTIGKAALSPTRTYAPVMINIIKEYKDKIGGIIHCTGGGQTKCKKFGKNIHYIKNDLLEIPPVFKIIKEASKTDYRELYQVFNMGHRLEIFTDIKTAESIIDISKSFNIDAKIIGELKESPENKVTIKSPDGNIEY